MTITVPDHLEQHLGPIEHGWSRDADGRSMPFQVVLLPGPIAQTVSFSTLGLSRTGLPSKVSGKRVRHELVLLVPRRLSDGPWPAILQQLGSEMLRSDRAVLRGDVLGPHGPLLPDSQMEALYASVPVYFPEGFEACVDDAGDVVFVWLIPIAATEAAYIQTNGWDAFETQLVQQDPDLTNVFRDPLRL